MIKIPALGSLILYVCSAVSGVLFVLSPSEFVSDAFGYAPLTALWGAFFIAGGIMGAASLVSRPYAKNAIATLAFEAGAQTLIATATFVYCAALLTQHQTIVSVALGILLFGGACYMVASAIKLYQSISTYQEIVERTDKTVG